MKKTGIAMLIAAFATQAGFAQAQTVEERLATLEKQAKRSEAKIKSIKKKSERSSDKMTVNGFFSMGVTAGNKEGVDYQGVTNKENTQYDSILGIQTTYKIDEKTDLTAQFVGKGDEGFKLVSDWAFISYKINNNLKVRAGRLRLPFYLMSENLEVGVSYPWVRPPCEVYCAAVIDAYEGADILYTFNTGAFSHTIQAFAGVGETATTNTKLIVNDSAGLNITSQYGDMTFRVGHAVGSLDVEAQPNSTFDNLDKALKAVKLDGITQSTGATFSGLGFKYDSAGLYLASEYTSLAIDKGIFADYSSAYLTAGYRFGSWMPYVTYATVKTKDDGDDRRQEAADKLNASSSGLTALSSLAASQAQLKANTPGTDLTAVRTQLLAAKIITQSQFDAGVGNDSVSLNAISESLATNGKNLSGAAVGVLSETQEHRSYSLGVRYDFSSRVAIKLQADRLVDLTKSNGGNITGATDDTAHFYSFVIDTAF